MNQVAFGIISWTGGQWTVNYIKEESGQIGCYMTGSCTGYGSFPFDKYPNIPVIDYSNNDKVFSVLSWNLIIEETQTVSEFDIKYHPERIVTVKEFLNRVHDEGILIHNYTE